MENEKELAEQVFLTYIKSKNLQEYHKKLEKIAGKNLSSSYLRDLRYVYYENYATNEEKIIHDEKCLLFTSQNENIEKIMKVLNISSDLDKCKYLDSLKYSFNELKNHISICIRRNPMYKNELISVFKKYRIYKDKKNKELNDLKKNERINNAKNFYDEMISLGYYDVSDYVRKVVVDDENSYEKIKSRVSGYNSVLKEVELSDGQSLFDDYKKKMEYNRQKCYMMNIEIIEEIKNLLYEHSIDAIDIYVMTGKSIDEFKKLCKGFLTNHEIILLNVINSRVFDKNIIKENIYSTKYSFNGIELTDSKKQEVLDFMDEHYIPIYYFSCFLDKFIDGSLDDYLKKSKVKKVFKL